MLIRPALLTILLYSLVSHALAIDDDDDDASSEQPSTPASFPETCEADEWKQCASDLSTFVWNSHTWYDNEPISLCEVQCSRVLKGHVSSKFRWVWDAKFQCDDRAPGIVGKARGFNTRREAMQSAIAQTLEQAMSAGLLTPNDLQC